MRIDPQRDWLEARIASHPDGWIRADRVVHDVEALAALRSSAMIATGPADDRSVGIMMMWRYADVAALGTVLLRNDRRVPSLDPRHLAFMPSGDTTPTRVTLASPRFLCLPDDRDARHPDATPVADLDVLREALVRRIEAFIEPVIDPLAAMTHLGRKALWGVAASATLAGLAWALAEAGHPDLAAAEVLALAVRGGPLATAPPAVEVVELRGERRLVLTHGVCCRAYLWPDQGHGKCLTCPIRPREDRIARQLTNGGTPVAT